jgi:hypothetical protein
MADELAAVVALLDANGVASIPYKGPRSRSRPMGDLGLREFGDLDLLVRAADVLRAKTLLAQRGYAMAAAAHARAGRKRSSHPRCCTSCRWSIRRAGSW